MRNQTKLLAVLAGAAAIFFFWRGSEAAHGLRGDMNNDGIINSLDITALELYIAGSYSSPTLTEDELFWRADVNGDGVINVLDITALEHIIASA